MCTHRLRALSFFLVSFHLLVPAHIGLSRCNAGCGVIYIVSGCTSNTLVNARVVDVFDNSTDESWTKAFVALTVRVTLAAVKTNTAPQRAIIASDIIIPKRMYVSSRLAISD
ncbi:hypothetical protein PR003_g12409 [Phytophthora rubi]|uniref:Secreted protein n=1 Tax=Phytophthora rubi TaxID=129364 RepID=A0A6A4F9A1_9STRA|nr:hypothetical protein PR001_g16605 [Phytophthora rubi]KAE9021883.1 hypothetical protein PR002_g12126 [Phytophthora rubi]KAE9336641.1 hypothetical protein PR003_g12409 [Phytophthora rubi]